MYNFMQFYFYQLDFFFTTLTLLFTILPTYYFAVISFTVFYIHQLLFVLYKNKEALTVYIYRFIDLHVICLHTSIKL